MKRTTVKVKSIKNKEILTKRTTAIMTITIQNKKRRSKNKFNNKYNLKFPSKTLKLYH